jgi:hypothetical protein
MMRYLIDYFQYESGLIVLAANYRLIEPLSHHDILLISQVISHFILLPHVERWAPESDIESAR